MNALEIILGIIVLLLAVGITVMVIMQEGRQKNLSGTIAGGAESFFGKQKGKTVSKMLDKATTIAAIVFAVLVLLIFIIQPEKKTSGSNTSTGTTSQTTSSVTSSDESADASVDTSADESVADTSATEESKQTKQGKTEELHKTKVEGSRPDGRMKSPKKLYATIKKASASGSFFVLITKLI